MRSRTHMIKLSNSLLVALLISAAASAKEARVETSVTPERVFIGEAARLTIKVHGFQRGMDPDLSAIPDCTVQPRGHSDQSIISIVNGRRTGFSGRIFQYDISPGRTGTVQLGPIHIHDGKTTTTVPGPTIAVLGVEDQHRVLLFLEPSKTEVIVDEPFSVDLRVLIQRLPRQYDDTSPLPTAHPPHLRIPYLKDDVFEGLEGPRAKDILNPRLLQNRQTPGLAVNDFTVESDPFQDFFNMRSLREREQPARFDFNPTKRQHDGRPYFEYTLSLKYTPIAEGQYTFGPVTFKGDIFVDATDSGQGITESIFAVAPSQTVRVAPPPEEGRPASYVGAIGRQLAAKASLDAQTCKVGDPLTLEIGISGDIRLENLFAPRLSLQEDLSKDFRIYEDTVHSETRDDTRIYRYTARPSRAGTYEFPPIAISFYNTETRTYDTVWTDPIPVRANPATEVEKSIVIDTVEQSVTIVAQDTDPNLLVPAPISITPHIAEADAIFVPGLHIPLLLFGPFLYLLGVALHTSRRLFPAGARRHRRATAAANTLERLAQAPSMAATSPTNARREIATALRQYIEMRLDLPASALTPADLASVLSRHKISSDVAQSFTALVQQNFNASFQSGEQSLSDIRRDATAACTAVAELDGELQARNGKQRRPLLSVRRWLPILMIGIASASWGQPAAQSAQFESQLAMSQLMAANTANQFHHAAHSLDRLIALGARNAPLFYNYGTALLLAGHHQAALNAFVRAERYSGTTWELKRNMRLAIRGANDGLAAPKLPWYRAPLFWHFGMSGRVRVTVASVAILMIWISFLLRMTGLKDTYRTVLGVAIAILILFGSSAATTLYMELRADTSAVLIPSESEAHP
jgi:hypothetical protein